VGSWLAVGCILTVGVSEPVSLGPRDGLPDVFLVGPGDGRPVGPADGTSLPSPVGSSEFASEEDGVGRLVASAVGTGVAGASVSLPSPSFNQVGALEGGSVSKLLPPCVQEGELEGLLEPSPDPGLTVGSDPIGGTVFGASVLKQVGSQGIESSNAIVCCPSVKGRTPHSAGVVRSLSPDSNSPRKYS